MEPSHPFERAALVAVRSRRGNPCFQRGRFRLAQRFASGMTVAEVARAEGREEAAIEGLLAQERFRALVASQKALAERPVEEQTARLVILARQAIENALSDCDVGAAFFVLREHSEGRDPARTVANRILASARRTAAPAAAQHPSPPATAPAAPHPYDPLDGLVHRRTAALRHAVIAEHAVREAAGTEPRETPARPPRAATTASAARRALALKRQRSGSLPPTPRPPSVPAIGAEPAPAPHRTAAAAPSEPIPLAARPRRPQAP